LLYSATEQQKTVFISSRVVDIIHSPYYIHGPWGDKNMFLLFYMCHFTTGLTHCYKTTFFTFIFAVFLGNLLYTFGPVLPAISAADCLFCGQPHMQ